MTRILKASAIITMEADLPQAEAVAVDTSTGTITAVGSLADVQASAPDAEVIDLGSKVLMPGFVDPHSHPILSGVMTQEPAHWIAPYVSCPTYDDVKALWTKLDAETPAGQPLLFSGLDRMLQGAPELTNVEIDEFFPSRPVVVADNSGHEAYFNTATMKLNGWTDNKPPADPVGASFGRNDDGTSNGRAYETAAVEAAISAVLQSAIPHPLLSGAKWIELMARNGITMTSEHTYQDSMLKPYEVLTGSADSPVRVALYHVSTEETCGDSVATPNPEMMWKQGIKLWADGSPWVGTMAASFPYLDTPTTENAQIAPGVRGESVMNYTRVQLDQLLDTYADTGLQFAIHCNGDVALDIVLDAYARALVTKGLMGTDHRWRVEHVSGCRGDQFARAASLGVEVSMLAAHVIYWGDLLDGSIFEPEIGSQWIRAGDAFKSGASVSFHNDGLVTPPIPLLNVQTMVTRRTPSGELHGPIQQISLEDAFRAHTINAARHLFRDHDLGSIKVGKLADFVELSANPFEVDVTRLTDEVKVEGTWVGGHKPDLSKFIAEVQAVDPTEHHQVRKAALEHVC